MESIVSDNKEFYVIIVKVKGEIWIRGKDICNSLGTKDYKKMR